MYMMLVTGKAVKNKREPHDGRWDKHDRKDVAVIADLVAQGKYIIMIIRQTILVSYGSCCRCKGG